MLNKKEHTALKSRLTRAKNSGDPDKVIAEVNHAFEIFENKGFPDTWHTWNIAKNDAEFQLFV